MSEYSQGDDGLERLIGSPKTGGGRIGAFLEEAKEGFILYDEIEKSKPGFFTILLQQLDDARITLGNNKTCDLSNFFIVCTSNVGANIFQNTKDLSDTRVNKALESILKERFSPEFIARFGQHGWGILTFKPLSPATLRLISQKFFKNEIKRFKKLNFHAHGYDEEFHELVLSQINSTQNGAREIRNIVKRLIQSCVNKTFRNNHEHIENGISGWLHYKNDAQTGAPNLSINPEKKKGKNMSSPIDKYVKTATEKPEDNTLQNFTTKILDIMASINMSEVNTIEQYMSKVRTEINNILDEHILKHSSGSSYAAIIMRYGSDKHIRRAIRAHAPPCTSCCKETNMRPLLKKRPPRTQNTPTRKRISTTAKSKWGK